MCQAKCGALCDFSVLAAVAAEQIGEDGCQDDLRFAKDYKALLLKLYGDDAMPCGSSWTNRCALKRRPSS